MQMSGRTNNYVWKKKFRSEKHYGVFQINLLYRSIGMRIISIFVYHAKTWWFPVLSELYKNWSFKSFMYKTSTIYVNSQTFCRHILVLMTRFCIIFIRNNLYLEDFLVNGDCSIRCFHSKSRFMDSSRCSLRLSSSKSIEINVWR